MTKRILALAALAALSTASYAQGMGGAGMMRMMRGGPMASMMMVGREDVQAEIKITDEQKGKLDAIRVGAGQRFQSVFMSMPRNEDREAMMKAMQEKMQGLIETMSKEVLGLLTEDQKKRVKELAIQSAGSMAIIQPDVSKELGITEAQKAKIDNLQRLQDEANQGLFEKLQNQEIDREELGKSMEKNTKIMDESIMKILTETQRAKLKALGGAPFAFKDPKPGTPGSFRRPGGGL